MPINTLKTVYYSYFNVILTYGLPFWGNLPHSIKIFRMQKTIITIIAGYKKRVKCRSLFKRLEILPLMLQYILSLMLFIVKNKHYFVLNSENHTKSTRQLNNFCHPLTNLTVYQKGVHYMGIKIFHTLLPYIKDTSNNIKKFENCLKQFLHIHSFYSHEE